MLLDPTTAQDLKPWLVRTLEPICDAEPGALSDYILALLKHNVPESEMRKELATQLEEFLEKEGPPFIDTLFTVLRTKSYLPYSTYSPPGSRPGEGIPIPLDPALMSPTMSLSPGWSRKRSLDGDDRDGRPPKGPRLSGDAHPSRHASGRDSGGLRPIGVWNSQGDRRAGRGMGVHGLGDGHGRGSNGSTNGRHPHSYQPPDQKRPICRDYHNYGYCARGVLCRFSHGDDAVVPGQLFPMPGAPAGLPFIPMFPPNPMILPMPGLAGAYDPHEARMDMRPGMGPGVRIPPRVPTMPRRMQGDANMLMNTQGELPVIQDLTPEMPAQEQMPGNDQGVSPSGNENSAMNGAPVTMDVDMMSVMPTQTDMFGMGGVHRPGPMGRGRGGGAPGMRPDRRKDETLVVEKIPEDKLTLEAVNDWFKRFGTVTNVAIDSRNAKALVRFADHDAAHAAWKSEEAVFGNRFVKVFWHRPVGGHGQTGAKMLEASASLLANMTVKETVKPSESASPNKSTTPARKTTAATTNAIAAKKELLERQIAEQKSLMTSLESASSEEKKEIMVRLRKLRQEMDAAAAPASEPGQSMSDHERKEKERLDKELDMAHAAPTEAEESKEQLKLKLAKLQAEAARLGLPEAMGQPASYRPYRGRGRGSRAYFRGGVRGRAAMTLDNRPKKLLVKGVPGVGLQAVQDWYETTGQLESVEQTEGDAILVSFKTRSDAEQGFAKGNNIPTVGQVSITWVTATRAADGQDDAKVHRAPSPEPVPIQEEEVVSSGWGGGPGDEGDGMGML